MRRLIGAVAVAIALLVASPAIASPGDVKIHDNAGVLDSAGKDAVTAAAKASPFEVHVLTVMSAPSSFEFERQVSGAVNGPNVLAIGVEMQHRITTVMYGAASGVPQGKGAELGLKAREFFKTGNFGQGIAAIITGTAALRAVEAPPPAPPPGHYPGSDYKAPAPPPPFEDEGHPWLWTFFFISLFGFGAWWYVRRRNRQAADFEARVAGSAIDDDERQRWSSTRDETSYHSSMPSSTRPYSPSYTPSYSRTYSRPSVSAPAPSTTVINNNSGGGGGGDLATGILLGQAMSGGGGHSHDTYIEREVVREVPAPAPASTSSWSDPSPSSSSSSSWSDPSPSSSSSSSSSWDSGNSSSSSSSWSDSSSSSSSDSSSSWSSSSDSSSSWSSSDSSSSSSFDSGSSSSSDSSGW